MRVKVHFIPGLTVSENCLPKEISWPSVCEKLWLRLDGPLPSFYNPFPLQKRSKSVWPKSFFKSIWVLFENASISNLFPAHVLSCLLSSPFLPNSLIVKKSCLETSKKCPFKRKMACDLCLTFQKKIEHNSDSSSFYYGYNRLLC